MKNKVNKEINTSRTLVKAFSIAFAIMMIAAVANAQQLRTITHTYAKGWNLVAVPLQPQDTSPYAVFDEVTPLLWLYDYIDGFEVGADESLFTNICPGRGYNFRTPDILNSFCATVLANFLFIISIISANHNCKSWFMLH